MNVIYELLSCLPESVQFPKQLFIYCLKYQNGAKQINQPIKKRIHIKQSISEYSICLNNIVSEHLIKFMELHQEKWELGSASLRKAFILVLLVYQANWFSS